MAVAIVIIVILDRRGGLDRGAREPGPFARRARCHARRVSGTSRRRRKPNRRSRRRPSSRLRAASAPTRRARRSAAASCGGAAARSSSTSRSTRRRSASRRRQFLNRGLVAAVGLRARRFRRRVPRRSCGRSRIGRVRRHRSRSASSSDILAYIQHEPAAVLRAGSPRLRRAVPAEPGRPRQGQEDLQACDLQRHVAARDRRAVPAVRAPRLPRPVLPVVAVVRVPVPRFEVQPGRREEGGPGAAWPRSLLRHEQRRRRSPSTPATSTSDRRSVPTRPARTPKDRCASEPAHRPRRPPEPPFVIAALWKNDLRHWLIWLNIIAFTALIIYVVRSVFCRRARSRTRSCRRTSRSSSPTTTSRAGVSSACRAGRCCSRRSSRSRCPSTGCVSRPVRTRRRPTSTRPRSREARPCSRTRRCPTYNAAVAAVRELPRRQGPGRRGSDVDQRKVTGRCRRWTRCRRFNRTRCSLRFSPDEVHVTIITYGRPGTPMQAWGVAGGGPKNDQSIQDLVEYINSIQITPAQAKAQATAALAAAKSTDPNTVCPEYVTCPAVEVAAAKKTLDDDTKALDAAREDVRKTLAKPDYTDAQVKAACNEIQNEAENKPNPSAQTISYAIKCGTYLTAAKTVDSDNEAYQWSLQWQASRVNVSDGQILFEMNCARCHTEGWSMFDPTVPPSATDGVEHPGPLRRRRRHRRRDRASTCATAARCGASAPTRTAGSRRSRTSSPWAPWPNKPYGILGIGTGRMPGFGAMLSSDQIAEIVSTSATACRPRTTRASRPCARRARIHARRRRARPS